MPNDYGWLWRILSKNASKYSPEQAVIKVNLVQTVDEIRISVRDQGSVLPKMTFRKCSKNLHVQNRLSTQVGGSGLGMYLASKNYNAA
ncbi:sensor histidine kinase [bacterium]|nr:MAG: sensor histidine kinase [bacterium]